MKYCPGQNFETMFQWMRSKVDRKKATSSEDESMAWVKKGDNWVKKKSKEEDSPKVDSLSVAATSSDDETVRCSSFIGDNTLETSARVQSTPQRKNSRWVHNGTEWIKKFEEGSFEDQSITMKPPRRRPKSYAMESELSSMLQGANISFGCVMALPPVQYDININSKALATDEDHQKEEMCPICCEVRHDVHILDHWEDIGDISEHKMCGNCRLKYPAHECPFCKELLHKNEFICIMHDFVVDWKATAGSGDTYAMTSLFEQWQILEMQFEGNLRVISRLAKLVIEDESFISVLSNAVDQKEVWIRDMAGILFRFWGLIHDTELDCMIYSELINTAIECILEPFERIKNPIKINGEKYAAIYIQVLTAWLCASKSGFPTTKLRCLVRRVGTAIVHCYHTYQSIKLRNKIASSFLRPYLQSAQVPIWGSKEDDIVWYAFLEENNHHSISTQSNDDVDTEATDDY